MNQLQPTQLKTIHLHGSLKEFGDTFELNVTNTAMATRALIANLGDKFEHAIRKGRFHVVLGDLDVEKPHDIGEDELLLGTSKKDIHIIPYVEGSSGVLRVIVGVVLIVAGLYFHQSWLVNMGASMALSGVAAMLTPTPKSTQSSNVAQNPSFIFNGAVNTVAQGGPIPLVYGRFRTGSVVISSGLETAELPTADAGGVPADGTVAKPKTKLQAKN
jgi:predicted phage tail protein